MSDNENRYLKFEEGNWDELAEKFIKKYEEQWIDFIDEEYQKTLQEPDDSEDR